MNIANRELLWLFGTRLKFRAGHTLRRFLSPRRMVASALTILFLVWYAFIGFAVLSTREAADPARLQLWLSGGMVLYAIYHSAKCAWSSHHHDLELTPAESLWLCGGPLSRRSIAVYHVTDLILPTFIKSLFLSVVLYVDVRYPALLIIGVFSALLLLEVIRMTVFRVSGVMGPAGRIRLRWTTTLIAAAVLAQVLARVCAAVPWGAPIPVYLAETFRAIGSTASCDAIQWLSMPWIACSKIAVTQEIHFDFWKSLVGCLIALPIATTVYVWVDRMCGELVHRREVQLWKSGRYADHRVESIDRSANSSWWHRFASASSMASSLGWIDKDAAAIASRVATSVSKYRGTLWFSFLIPTALCLSPIVSPQVRNPWFFVVGGIGTCTMLLAPASVRLDFRRDLKRMMLLHSLPIAPRSMVLGQLYFPVVVTWMFQFFVLVIAGLVLRPGLASFSMWAGMLMALAVFVFAVENALFLAYPHEERAQGVAMMIRSKLTFLGKMTLAVLGVISLAAWVGVCEALVATELIPSAMAAGALIATWTGALMAFSITTWVWRRWDDSAIRIS